MLKNILMSLAIVSFAGAAVANQEPKKAPAAEETAPAAEEEATQASK